jgi:uncharacterized protein (DUF983 family)
MFVFPCPYCGAGIKAPGNKSNRTKCPSCGKALCLLDTDDTDIQEAFPFVKWLPCDDGRSSKEHVALATCGINGTAYFRLDDPVLSGWWDARRKGLRPCRCTESAVYKSEAEKLRLLFVFVNAPPFDPWSTDNDCELMGWGSNLTQWNDRDYENHPGNPDRKHRLKLATLRIHFSCPECDRTYSVSGAFAGKKTVCRTCGNELQLPMPEELPSPDEFDPKWPAHITL